MFAVKKAPLIDTECDGIANRLAVGAGKIYWLTMLLVDSAEDAAAATRQSIELLLTGNRVFDVWLARWACKVALKACIANKRSELVADQRNTIVWNGAVDHLQLDGVQRLRSLSLESIQRAVRALPILPRFMFVLHVLERYTLQESARLLELDKTTCDAALGYGLAVLTQTIHSSQLACWTESHRSA